MLDYEIDSLSPAVSKRRRRTPGIYLAAIVLFVISMFLFVGILLDIIRWPKLLPLLILPLFMFITGVKILKLQKLGYYFGMGIVIALALLYTWFLIKEGWFLVLSLAAYGICFLIFISLYTNRKSFFYKPEFPEIENISAPSNILKATYSNKESSTEENLRYRESLLELNKLIEKERRSFFVVECNNKIIILLSSLCSSIQYTEHLLRSYEQVFGKDLITDLMGITNSYGVIKQYLEPFIRLSVVAENYPHKRLSQTAR
ncbi:MAG: hypothetical protein ACK4ND_09675 [Cytophagaceae bacterium]